MTIIITTINKKLKRSKFAKSLKKRGISPVLAVVLMIGLTVVSGAMLATVTNSILSQKTAVNLEINSDNAIFKTTETNYRFADDLIDRIEMPISNPLEEPIVVDLTQTYLYNATDDTIMVNWGVVSDASEIVLNGKESTTVTFATDSSIYTSELKNGDQVYVVFKSNLFGDSTQTASLQSSTFSVQLSNSDPVFQVVPVLTANQTLDTLYFSANNNEENVQNLTLAIFNYGNSQEAHQKTVSITLENSTVFSIANGFETQVVTVPTATQGGDFGVIGFCEAGEACVNVTVPIIKHNLTQVNITNLASKTFGAIVSVSGLDFVSFNLVLQPAPEFKIGLKTKPKDGIFYDTIIFDKDIEKEKDIKFEVYVWNMMKSKNSGTFELINYNTTVFQFKNKKDPNPMSLSFNQGPSQKFSKCKGSDGCEKIKWVLTRNPLVDKKSGNSTGILPGSYTATIRETRTGQTFEITIIIPDTVRPIHIDSTKIKVKKDKIELKVYVKDIYGMPIKDVKVYITVTDPDGKVKTYQEKTDKKGEAKFKIKAKIQGDYYITITDLVGKNKKGYLYPYDPSANLITNPFTIKV